MAPPLRLTPTAWAKLQYLRDAGPTEIGGFGIAPSADLLLVEDIQLVRQLSTATSVEFDDAAVAEFFDEYVDARMRPEQFARIWVHTHPGESPRPSQVDETTFRNVFGACDWSVMFILARGGATYARMQLRAGPGAAVQLPVRLDWQTPFGGSDERAWQTEYELCVRQFVDPSWQEPHEQRFAVADSDLADVPWEPHWPTPSPFEEA
jgi:proteasome lid subunit RPN8/RPN11